MLIFKPICGGRPFVLLFDDRNPAFRRPDDRGQRGLLPFLMEFVPEQHRGKVIPLTIQKAVRVIEVYGRHDDWIGKFAKKYGLGS